MTAINATEDFSAIVTVRLPSGDLNTPSFFSTEAGRNFSPIDEFLTNAVTLNLPPSVRIVVTPIENTNDKMGTDRETNFTRT
ncbi:hypothetical protein [Dickeya solani]|uniref:Uncharacterized protein n=1 Tax=Dickeya solani TaxID=1089444 RepID=A0AAX4F5W0_9GAMM|nr:hypothetical protein [Dickeya solani]WOA54735.1 hypothetical protein RXA29_11200 [Dickeya solani]